MSVTLFWIAAALILYTYFGYPLLQAFWARFREQKTDRGEGRYCPSVSVVIAVFNEEQRIGKRLENILAQDYPAELLELVVVSDGSTDRTGEVVCSFKESNLALYRLPEKSGKAAALNYGIARTHGEIIVFADARQYFANNTIRQLVANFADQTVGCVSGELCFLAEGSSEIKTEMGAYWFYEKWIRKNESRSGSTVGATGAVYAIRRKLYKTLPEGTILDDLLTPLNIVMAGYRSVFDPSAVAFDTVSTNLLQEWQRKVRTLAGNWQLISLAPDLFSPKLNPVWWRFISHKILRLLVPVAMLVLFISGSVAGGFYFLLSMTELAFCLVAAIGALAPSVRRFPMIKLCYFFMTLNSAVVVGFWQWISGRCDSIWQPVRTVK